MPEELQQEPQEEGAAEEANAVASKTAAWAALVWDESPLWLPSRDSYSQQWGIWIGIGQLLSLNSLEGRREEAAEKSLNSVDEGLLNSRPCVPCSPATKAQVV